MSVPLLKRAAWARRCERDADGEGAHTRPMTLALRVTIGLALGAALAYLATPYAIALAERMKFYDEPVGYKAHARPTPYLGGLAVMAAFVLALAAAAGHWSKTAPLLGRRAAAVRDRHAR